jgi:uncharacterized protein (TIGR04562 family)
MQRLVFDPFVISSVVGGESALDIPRLNITNEQEAENFIRGYGFDLSNEAEHERLWYFHRRALVLIEERLGFEKHEIPEILHDRKSLGDLKNLLLWASEKSPDSPSLQKWSCAILRVMHVFVHAENDLFATFSEEIQKQILTPFQNCIYNEGSTGTTFLRGNSDTGKMDPYPLPVEAFEVKPFKTSASTVIKLLAKHDALAMRVFDKVGLRFVTRTMFDTFRVIRFLVEQNLISFPHIMPDQSSNNLYPVDLFLKVSDRIANTALNLNPEQITGLFEKALRENPDHEGFFRKDNSFSGQDYRFIKFIARKLIQVNTPSGTFNFFYPYEVQILDIASYKKILSGPSEHQAYKERQVSAARKRILAE